MGSGSVALNGSLLAGGLMVKDVPVWEELKANNHSLDDLLSKIGILRDRGGKLS